MYVRISLSVYLFVCLCLSGLIQLIIRKHIKVVSIDGLLALLAACLKQTCLARSAKLPEGLYILPMFFLYFFSGRPWSPAGSEANGPIFTKISGLVDN